MSNKYVARADFLEWVTPQDTSAEAVDDNVIDDIIEAASRHIDGACARTFYPCVETRYYDIPNGRALDVDSDLLFVISLLNGDDTVIAGDDYNLFPRNQTPYSGLKLKQSSSTYWESDSDGATEWVVGILAEWGYHNNYAQRAWLADDALDGAITANALTFNMPLQHGIKKDQIVKVDNELLNVASVTGQTVTVSKRGDNGSTAAAHADDTTVYIWQTQADIVQAVKLIAQSLYRRFGSPNQSDESIVTASGVIITPKDIPGIAARTIRRYQRLM